MATYAELKERQRQLREASAKKAYTAKAFEEVKESTDSFTKKPSKRSSITSLDQKKAEEAAMKAAESKLTYTVIEQSKSGAEEKFVAQPTGMVEITKTSLSTPSYSGRTSRNRVLEPQVRVIQPEKETVLKEDGSQYEKPSSFIIPNQKVPDTASRIGQTITSPTTQATRQFVTERVRQETQPSFGPQPQFTRNLTSVKEEAIKTLKSKTTVNNVNEQLEALNTAKSLTGTRSGRVQTDIRTEEAKFIARKEDEILSLMQKEDIKTIGTVAGSFVIGAGLGAVSAAAPVIGKTVQTIGAFSAPIFAASQGSALLGELKRGETFAATQRIFRIGGSSIAAAAGFKIGQIKATPALGKQEFVVKQLREPIIAEKAGVKKLIVKESKFTVKGTKPKVTKDLDIEFKEIAQRGEITRFSTGKGKLSLKEKTFKISERKLAEPFGSSEITPSKPKTRIIETKVVKDVTVAKGKGLEVKKKFEFKKVQVVKEKTTEIKLEGASDGKVSITKGKFIDTKDKPKVFSDDNIEFAVKTDKAAAVFGKQPKKEFLILEQKDQASKQVISSIFKPTSKPSVSGLKTNPSGLVAKTVKPTAEFKPIVSVKAVPIKTTNAFFIQPEVKRETKTVLKSLDSEQRLGIKTKQLSGIKSDVIDNIKPARDQVFKKTVKDTFKFDVISDADVKSKVSNRQSFASIQSVQQQVSGAPFGRGLTRIIEPPNPQSPKIKLPEPKTKQVRRFKDDADLQRQFSYLPTVFAAVLKIKAKSKKAKGGLGLRPI